MKLRFRGNSVRLRLNRREVESLAAGRPLQEGVDFPGHTRLDYSLHSEPVAHPEVSFQNGSIRISAPLKQVKDWAAGDEIGLYFNLPANGATLTVAIEKDLECVDGSPGERDPDAFPRSGRNC
jgi:hypothetical protein